MQVEELQKRLMGMEEDAAAARSAATESLRLTDENALLGNQLKQMEINLKVPPTADLEWAPILPFKAVQLRVHVYDDVPHNLSQFQRGVAEVPAVQSDYKF